MKSVESPSCQKCIARNNSIFRTCSFDILSQMDGMKSSYVYAKGEELFQVGHHPKGIFCVVHGKIKVYQKGVDGKEQIVHLISDGNIMGHRALFGEDTYSCSAIALEDSQVCFLPKSDFYEMISKDGKLTFKIAQLLAHELKEAEDIITRTAQQSVIARLAKTLMVLYKHYGFKEDQQTINIQVKRDDLASMVGTTRETVTRTLYNLKNQEIIDLVGKEIKICSLKQLEKIAE